MGHAAGPEFKAQMDLGTTVPYIYVYDEKIYCGHHEYNVHVIDHIT